MSDRINKTIATAFVFKRHKRILKLLSTIRTVTTHVHIQLQLATTITAEIQNNTTARTIHPLP